MRACFVLGTDLFQPTPIFRATKEIKTLQEGGTECAAVCWIKSDAALPSEETIEGVRILRIAQKPLPQRALNVVRRYRQLRRVTAELASRIGRLNPNLIIAHDLEVLAAGVRAARGLRVPIVFDAHEDWPSMVGETSPLEGWLASILERRLCRHVGAVVTPSDRIRDKYRGMGLRSETLYNSPYRREVDPLPDAAAIDRTRTDLRLAGRFILGFSGTLAPQRGLETTIEALTLLPEDATFLVVGGPDDERARFERLARDRGVGDRVRFVGRVPRGDVPRYIAAFDLAVVLLPPVSANYLAALPNKVFDYMAAGIPILASELPELRRLIETDVRCGTTVRPEPSAVAASVSSLRSDRDRLRELGQRGRRAFLERFAWDHQATKFLAVLRELGISVP